ncbi:MAG TPA: FAD-dependent oxidoreductase [Gemmatimonadaceae bacterium]|nr:FAD-dependent oxidoreductase [Gemmatimonadaceae bacterium]
MPLPVLLVIDADPDALEDVEAQLVGRYGSDYRIERASDPDEALHKLAELADAAVEVALVLAAEWSEGATVAGLLERARQLHPHAKRGLMVSGGALADPSTAQAILDSIAMGRIDYYVPKPAGSPDEVFHHTISGFLLEWATEQRKVPHTVHIVGEEWSGRAYELRETFERCAAPHTFCLADSEMGRELLAQAGPDAKLPLMVLPDGRALSDPSNAEIAEAAGTPADFDARDFDVVIVGAGPAGLSAAVYAASEGLRTLVVDEGGIGGQARSSSLIRNYLGFPRGVSGSRLAEQAYEQASVFGASFVFMHRVTELDRAGGQLVLALADGRRVGAAVAILCTGASYRRLDVPSLEALTGAGVFYGGPASEAHALSGKDVFVAGGGNSAGQAALHLARYARRVTLVVRAGSLAAGMSHYLTQEVAATPSVDVRTGTTVVGGGGDGRLQELVLRDGATGAEETVAADALFVLIGARPHTDWLPSQIARDPHGFLYTGEDVPSDRRALEHRPVALETSMPGVLAAGDVRHGSAKRVASAVGEGSVAVQLVHGLLAGGPASISRAAAGQGS